VLSQPSKTGRHFVFQCLQTSSAFIYELSL